MLKTWILNLKQLTTLLPKRDLVAWSAAALLPFIILVFLPSLTLPVERAILDFKTVVDQHFINTEKLDDVVILGIDSQSLEKAPHKWPWPAFYWAEVLRKLDEKYQPKVMLIDIYFQDEQRNTESLKLLSQEMQRNGKTGLVGIFEESTGLAGKEIKTYPPLKILREKAAFWGISQQPIDSDGNMRTFTLADVRLNKKHVSYELLKHLSGFTLPVLPAQKTSSAIFRFKSRDNSAMTLSLIDVLDNDTPAQLLLGKCFIIGPNAPILHDYHKTAVGVLSGPTLVFNSIATLHSGSFQVIYTSLWLQLFMVCLGVICALFCFSDFFQANLTAVIITGGCLFTAIFAASLLLNFQIPAGAAMLSFSIFSIINLLTFRFLNIVKIRDSLREAEICGHIQQNFFPATGLTSERGVQIDGFCQPYLFAGGDYYDFLELPDGSFFFILADVSGHGISAAMITTAAKSIVMLHSRKAVFSIEELFLDINFAIRRMSDRRIMMSAVAGLIFPEKSLLQLYSAGHLPAHLVTTGEVKEFPIPGMPLGSSKKKHRYGFVEVSLPTSGQLVLYSDGVIEALDWQDKMLGFDGFKKLLEKKTGSTPKETIKIIIAALENHCEGRSFTDDVTILVINLTKSKN